MGDIAKGDVFDLPILSIGASQQVGLVDLALIVAFGSGYVDGAFFSAHGVIVAK